MSHYRKSFSSNFFFDNILLLFFGYDFLVKISVSFFGLVFLYNYAIIFKTIIILLAIPKLDFKIINKAYLNALILFSVSYVAIKFPAIIDQEVEDINFNGYYFLSSIVPIIFLIFYNNNRITLERQINSFLFFIGLSCLFVFIGYIFSFDFLRSYFRGQRFGYSGFLLYHHESGYIYFIALILAYKKLKEKKTYFTLIVFSLILASSILIGTKKTMFLIIISLIYFLVDNLNNLKKGLYFLFSFTFVSLIFYKTIIKIFNNYFQLFNNIYKDEGFWAMFLSHRNNLLVDNLIPYAQSNLRLINIIFGWPLFRDYRCELELFDLFLFFGLTGIASYILIFKKLLIKSPFLNKFFVFSLVLATLFSGNLFASVNVMILMVISLSYIGLSRKTTYESF